MHFLLQKAADFKTRNTAEVLENLSDKARPAESPGTRHPVVFGLLSRVGETRSSCPPGKPRFQLDAVACVCSVGFLVFFNSAISVFL